MIFRFANEAYLQLLWGIPAIAALALWSWGRSAKALEKSFGKRLGPFLAASVSTKRRRLRLVFELLALTFFILALARPQAGTALQAIKSEGVEMMFLMDVSNSMLAEDIKPSRLEQAKTEIGRLLDKLGGHKAGLVVFAGSAFLVSPLTTDYSAIKMFLETLGPDSVSSQGTNFKMALEEAELAFDRGGVDADEETRVTRVVVIVSDGEDQEKGAVDFASSLSKKGTVIFTIGFGTDAGAPIPDRDERGYLRGYKKDEKGQVILSTHRGETLAKLASAGGGKHYHGGIGGMELDQLVKDLDKLRKAQFESSVATDYDERFQPFLLVGLIFLLLDLLAIERVGKAKHWRGRFEEGAPA